MEKNLSLNNSSAKRFGLEFYNFAFWALVLCFSLIIFSLGPLPFALTAFLSLSGQQEPFTDQTLSEQLSFIASALNFMVRADWESILDALKFSLWQAGCSTVLTIVPAALIARSLYFNDHAFGRRLLAFAQIPFGLPSIIVSFAFIVTYGNSGILNSLIKGYGLELQFLYNKWTIIHAHVFFNLGMCSKKILERYQTIPRELMNTSEALNLGPWLRFFHVEFPQIKGELKNLSVIVFGYCLTSFAIIITLGGSPAFTSLEVLIYQFVRYDIDFKSAFVASIAQVLLLMAASLPFIKSTQRSLKASVEVGPKPAKPSSRLSKNSLNHYAILLALFLFIGLPIAGILNDTFDAFHNLFWQQTATDWRSIFEEIFRAAGNSLIVAVPVAASGCMLSIVLAQALVRFKGINAPGFRSGETLAHIVTYSLLALSPTALGFSWTATMIYFELDPGSKSAPIIIAVQSFLFAPLGLRLFYPTLKDCYAQWQQTYGAIGLGTGLQTFYIEFRAIRSQILSCFMLILAFSIGDVSIPALFAAPDFTPLSMLLMEYIGSYQFEKASLSALTIAFFTQLLFMLAWLLNRGIQNPQRKQQNA